MVDWHKVEDILPEEGQQVLAWFGSEYDGGCMQIAYREKIKRAWYWMDSSGAAIGDATHWTHLPKPPRE